ncbi:MAG TPA: protein TolQ [Syntrophorhabdaceae bacterium]|jgi:biopolymer transport protein TolQ|nr:protein TolQ [Syntrophorhabdaceae bacterium]MDI9561112.1 protein TolQ [Pseudomonadota bacterium]OQC49487.1 MAG: Biopolymer transport protein ExbB [Deltaproteobacteria bacterium ADurb.Bin026]MBV6505323.1 Protein TolQ [Syntrophorhabdaceae bacterium]HNQ62935.1 protein TolQ [Syntrophorhabdaceae bacterium]
MGISSINDYTGGVLSLLYSAGPVAKIVVFILFLFSIISWTIIFFKWKQCKKIEKEGEKFFNAAKNADSYKKLISTYRENPDNAFYRLMLASYKEITSIQKDNPGIRPDIVQHVENILKITLSEETERLERRLSFLATTANTAPFIGLFGTVWGIMDSFREIGLKGTTSLSVVAPGISEALIATAIGLATAIPAVLAYNYFVGRLKRINSRMENAVIYIINLLEK